MDRILGFFDTPMLIDLAIQLFNVALLCALLAWLLYNPVKNFLRKRTERIANQITSAQKDYAAAQSAKAEYEQKLRDIDKERDTILDAARKQALDKEAEIIARARQEADTLKSRAALDIEREQEKSKDEMKKQIIEISTIMTSRYLATGIDQNTQHQLLNNIIADLGDAKWLN